MTKFILIIWIGSGMSQMMSTEKFDSSNECEAVASKAKIVLKASSWDVVECVPYTFEE